MHHKALVLTTAGLPVTARPAVHAAPVRPDTIRARHWLKALLALSVAVSPLAASGQPARSGERMAPRTGHAACDAAVDGLMPTSTELQAISTAAVLPTSQLGLADPPSDLLLALTLVIMTEDVLAVRAACQGLEPGRMYGAERTRQAIAAAVRRGPPVCFSLAQELRFIAEAAVFTAFGSDVEGIDRRLAAFDEHERQAEQLRTACGTTASRDITAATAAIATARGTLTQARTQAAQRGGASAAAALRNGSIAIGQTRSGELQTDDILLTATDSYADVYTLEGRRGQTVTATVRSSAFDTVVAVTGDGDFFQSNDDGPNMGTNSSLTFTFPSDGRFTLAVTSLQPRTTGAYTLSVGDARATGAQAAVPAPRPPAPRAPSPSGPAERPASVGRLAFGPTGTGTISGSELPSRSRGRPHDLWEFSGRAGQRVVIEVASSSFDTYAELVLNGQVLSFNDDAAGQGTNSRLDYTLPQSGIYLVQVSPFLDSGRGTYSIRLSEAGASAQPQTGPAGTVSMSGAALATALGGGAATPGSAAVPAVPSRQIDGLPVLEAGRVYRGYIAPGDTDLGNGQFVDNYVFEGRRGQRATLTMRSAQIDSVLVMTNESGFQASNDDGPNMGTDARIEAVLPADGLYTIAASALNRGRGEYTISVVLEGGAQPASPPPPTPPRARPARPAAPAPVQSSQAALPVLVPGRPVNASLAAGDTQMQSGAFVDNYAVEGRRGQQITLTMSSAAFDTVAAIGSRDGSFFQRNDDGPGMGTNSQLTVTLPDDGTYIVAASSYRNDATGGYTLTLTTAGLPAAPAPSKP